MKKHITSICLLTLLFFFGDQTYAQLNYMPGGFTTAIGTYTSLGSSGSAITVSNNDDAFSAPLPIGFTFNFNGAPNDSFIFSTNGFIKLGKDTPSRHFLFTSHAQPPANGPFTAATSPTPTSRDTNLLFAFGQDLYNGTLASVFRYQTTGSPGSQICTIEWKNVKDKTQASVAGLWDTINFQIKLYETTNVIEYIYGKWTSTVSVSAARFSAVGIVGNNMVTANQNMHLVKGSTVGWSGAVANTGFYLNNAVNYRNPTSTPAGPAPEIGRTYTFTPLTMNDAAVRAVYSQGRIAMPYYQPDSIRANILNSGVNALTTLVVTLTISGANTYTTTATIPSLAANANTNVSFAPFYPSNLGNSLVTVSVPTDDNNANNNKLYGMSVSNTRNAYTDTLVLASGGNGTTIPQFWGAKYFVSGTGLVSQVRSPLAANSDAVGDTVCGLVMDSLGKILARSPAYIVQTSDLGTTLLFNMTLPAVVTNQSVIVGIAGGQTINSLNYFLGTSQTEVPLRPNTAFYFMSQTAVGGISGANVGITYASPLAWTTTRLMMECTVDPLPPIDVGVSASGPIAEVIIPINTNIPLRAVVKNYGSQFRPNGIQVRYRVNGGAVIGPVSTTSGIAVGDTTSVLFSGANVLNVSSAGTYTVKIYTSLAGDGIIGNDTLTVLYVAAPINNLPYRIANNILGSWTTKGNLPALWKQKVAVQSNGLSNANVLWADNITALTNQKEALVLSPPLSLIGSTNPVLHFNVAHAPNTMTGLDDTLQVLLSTDGGLNFTPLYTKSSQFSSPTLGTDTPTTTSYTPAYNIDWRHESVNLGAFAGRPYVVIAFRDQPVSGNGIYIGNVSITNATNNSFQSISSTGTYSSGIVSVNFSSIGNTNGELAFSRYSSAPYSSASPVFATNTVANTNNYSIFTPNNVSLTHWYSIAYSGIGTGNYAPSVQYSITVDIASVPGIFSKDSLYILRRSDFNASWVPITTSVSGNTLYTGFLTGFSDFTIGSVSSVNSLPVKWFSFTAKKIDVYYNQLDWVTASEVNNNYFVVERSVDSEKFEEAGKLKAESNSSQKQFYSFRDKLPLAFEHTLYYRIKQVDLDGKFSYSNVISLSADPVKPGADIKVSNPFERVPSLWIDNNSTPGSLQIQVSDLSGKMVLEKVLPFATGKTVLQLEEMEGLIPGLYFLQVYTNGLLNGNHKIIKIR